MKELPKKPQAVTYTPKQPNALKISWPEAIKKLLVN